MILYFDLSIVKVSVGGIKIECKTWMYKGVKVYDCTLIPLFYLTTTMKFTVIAAVIFSAFALAQASTVVNYCEKILSWHNSYINPLVLISLLT